MRITNGVWVMRSLALLFLVPAVALGQLQSKTFYGAGTCNGQDQLPVYERAWEPVPIKIVGAEYAFLEVPANIQYVLIGNSYVPDVMMTRGMNNTQASHFFPAGLSFAFPSSAAGGDHHVDVHVGCVGGTYQLFLTLYYTR